MAPGIGLSVSAWLALLLKSIPVMRKGVAPEVLVLVIVLQSLVIMRNWSGVWRKYKDGAQRWRKELRDHAGALWMLGGMSVWWYYMSYIHYLLPKGSEHITGGSVYADLPFHLNLTTSFLNGCNEWATVFSSLMSSFFAGKTLAYPFMPDFFISVLVAGGWTLRWGLVITGWVLLSAMFSLIYMLNFRLSGSSRVGMLSVWFTLFAGGLGAFYYAAETPDWYHWDNLTNSKFMHGPDFVLYWSGGRSAYWFSLPAHILFPQRTVQHAYPLAISALLCIWHGMMGTPQPEKDAKDGEAGAEEGGSAAGAGGGEGGSGGLCAALCGGGVGDPTGEQQVLAELSMCTLTSSVVSAGAPAAPSTLSDAAGGGGGGEEASDSAGAAGATAAGGQYGGQGGGAGGKSMRRRNAGSSQGPEVRAGGAAGGGGGKAAGATSGGSAAGSSSKQQLLSPGGGGYGSAGSASSGGSTPTRWAVSKEYFSFEMQRKLFVHGGFLMGLIPLMQPHSYVSIGVIVLIAAVFQTATLLLWALLCGGSSSSSSKSSSSGKAAPNPWAAGLLTSVPLWVAFGVTAISMGAPQFLKHFVHRVTFGVGTRGNGFVRRSAVWEEEGKGETPAQTWWKALGIFMPLFCASLVLLRTREQRAFWAGFLTLFVVCNLIMFQPWHLDNTKLFYVFVFGASGYVALVLHRVLRIFSDSDGLCQARLGLPLLLRLPIRLLGYAAVLGACVVLCFSGAMATWREMLNYAKLYDVRLPRFFFRLLLLLFAVLFR